MLAHVQGCQPALGYAGRTAQRGDNEVTLIATHDQAQSIAVAVLHRDGVEALGEARKRFRGVEVVG